MLGQIFLLRSPVKFAKELHYVKENYSGMLGAGLKAHELKRYVCIVFFVSIFTLTYTMSTLSFGLAGLLPLHFPTFPRNSG